MLNKKIISVIIFFIALPISAYATTWVDEFPIYVDGDVTSIIHVFDAIIRVLKDDMVQDSILPMVMMIGLWTTIKSFLHGSKTTFFATVSLLVVGSMSLVYTSAGHNALTGVKVHVKDERYYDGNQVVKTTGSYSHYGTVDDVPYVLAMPIAVSSVVFYQLSVLIDDAFSSVDTNGIGATSIGFMGGTNVLMQAIKNASFDRTDETRAYRDSIKKYVSQCVVAIAINKNYSLMNKLTTPTASLLDSLKWFNDNSFGPDDTMDNGVKCTDYYTTNIANKTGDAKDKLLEELNQHSGVIDLSNTTLQSALEGSYLASVESNASASSNKFLNFLAEAPIMSAVLSGIKSQQLGADLAGQDSAIGSSIAKNMMNIQYEGIGQWRWLIEVFPFYIHFMRAVIYAVGMVVLFVIISVGYENGMPIYKNYVKGLITFEATVLSLTLVNALINEYSGHDAANQLFGGNPLTLAENGAYLDYVAKMEGIAGIVGLFAVFTIPSMMFRGEIGAAISGLSSIAGQYRGNAAQTLQDDSAKSSSARRVIDEASPEFIKKLHENGISAPQGASDLSLAGKVMSEMNNSSKQLADLGSLNQLSAVGQTGYANSKAQIEGGIASGQGRIDSGEIKADGSFSVDSAAELRQKSYESSLENITTGKALNSNFDSTVQQAKAEDLKDQAQGLREQASNIKNSQAYHNASPKEKKEYDREAQTLENRANSMDTSANNSLELDKFNPLSSNNRASAAQVMAVKNVAEKVAQGKGLEDTGIIDADGKINNNENRFNDFLKGSEVKTAQSTMESVGYGSRVDKKKAMNVSHDDGLIAGSTTNNIDDRREDLKNSNKPDIKWDSERIGGGNAISKVHGETKSQGIFNSLEKNDGTIDKAFIASSSGNEFAARMEENKSLGIGKKWKDMSDAEKISFMSKQQENSEADAFSGVEAKNAGIHKHHRKGGSDIDNFIEDAITTSQEKELSASKHAENMRETYGQDLKDSSKLYSKEEVKTAEDIKKKAESTIASDTATEAEKTLAKNDLKKANNVLEHKDDAISLSGTTSALDQSKIDSIKGQALAVKENVGKGVNYAENAMYGEESKQQTTQAKINTQGGINSAVATDVAESTLKAARQQNMTAAEASAFLQTPQGGNLNKVEADKLAQGIVDGSKQGGQELAKALMSAAMSAGAVAHGETSLKSTSSIATVDANKKAKILDSENGVTEKGKEALAIKPGQDTNSLMGKLNLGENSQQTIDKAYDAVYKKEMAKTGGDVEKSAAAAHKAVAPFLDENGDALKGQAFWNKQAELSAGVFMGHNSMLLGDGQIFSGAMTPGGGITGTLSSGVSSRENNSDVVEKGSQLVVKATDAKTLNDERSAKANGVLVESVAQQRNKLEAEGSPVGRAKSALAAHMVKESKEHELDPTSDTPLNDYVPDALNVASDAALGYTGSKAVDGASKFMAKAKVPMTKEDLESKGYVKNEDGIYEDRNGNIATEKNGKFYDEEGSPLEKNNPNKKAGPIERMIESGQKRAGDIKDALIEKFSPSSVPSEEESFNNSENKHNPNKDNGVASNNQEKFQHGSSLNLDNGDIVSNNDTNVKSYAEGAPASTPSEQIDESTTANRRNAAIKNQQRIRDNLMSVASSPEQRAQIESNFENAVDDIKEQYPTQAEKAMKHEQALAGAREQIEETQRFGTKRGKVGFGERLGKTAGGLGLLAVAGDLIASGRVEEAFDAVSDGISDTFNKTINGNIAGGSGAAANLSSVIIGKQATQDLAENNFALSAAHAMTNAADAVGQVVDITASAIVSPFSDKSYDQLRNRDFSISQSGANMINNISKSFMPPSPDIDKLSGTQQEKYNNVIQNLNNNQGDRLW